ncbi:MAG: crotonase/enoyl-CoA hydratase family protein [Gammaproteobacteria bacterium]|nr:crotonase/enoyl-CoA hydratase family protein [Gammaproteobacteria bacterium]
MNELVTLDVSDGIADVRLNRPDKHNSLTLDMFRAIAAAGESLADPAIRVAVLSGNGPSFCAGLDFSIMRAILDGGDKAAGITAALIDGDSAPENLAQRASYVWKTARVPVIAAICGVAYGGGCQIALGCDIRYASPDAKLSVMEMRYGLSPDMAITQTLPDLVAIDVAKELILTGRIVEAAEAAALGLVTRVVDDPLETAFETARAIARRSPDAVKAAKQLLNEAWRAEADTGLALEETLQRRLLGSRNQREAVLAEMEKREPLFY